MNPWALHLLKISAVVVAGTMTGNEMAVALFFHPRISRLGDAIHARTAQSLAKALGTWMPVWYVLTFLLSLSLTYVVQPRWTVQWWLVVCATLLFFLVIIYTLILPVPINNKIARLQPDSLPLNWVDLRQRWDKLHAIRVFFLIIALILLVASVVI